MKRIVTLTFFVFLYHISSSQVWTKKAAVFPGTGNNSGGRSTTAFSIASLGRGYVIAGAPNFHSTFAYDTLSDSWTQRMDFPSSEDGTAVGFAIDTVGYVGGGVSFGCGVYNTFYKYYPIANQWVQLPNVPGLPRGYATGFALGGKGYIGGGVNGCCGAGLNDFYSYDPVLNKWDTITPCPEKGCTQLAVGFSIGNYGYIGTGDSLSGCSGTPAQLFYRYDPSSNAWKKMADFPGGSRVGATGFATCSNGYIGLGQGGPNQNIFTRDFYQYDPINDNWKRIANFGGVSRAVASSFVIGNSCFVTLGYDSTSSNNTLRDIWEYIPSYAPAFAADSSICAGQSISFTDTSDYSPTSWRWSFQGGTPDTSNSSNPVIQYNAGGRYNVTLTASNGCESATKTFSNYVSVGSGGAFTVNANPTTICSGQSATLTASGTSTYTWAASTPLSSTTGVSITVNPTLTTTYFVTSSGGSCGSTDTLILLVGDNTIAGIPTATRDTICKGSSGNLALASNSSSAIQWQSSLNDSTFANSPHDTLASYKTAPLQQTTFYRAVVGTGNCSAISDTVELYVPPALIASFYATASSGTTLNFNSDSSLGKIRSYHWDFGDGGVSTDSNPSHTYANKDSTYYVCLTLYDGSNCSYTFCKYSSIADGVPTISAAGNWIIYPNPFSEQLSISAKQTNSHIQSIEMYDMLGQLVINKNLSGTTNASLQLDVSSLAKGIYYVMIRTADADYVQKVVKQ